MMKLTATGIAALASLVAATQLSFAQSATVTGSIHTIHVNLASNRVHVYLSGKPLFDGGACQSFWTGNSLDDAQFHDYIYPLLLAAKAAGEPVSISVDGCMGAYPVIYSVDSAPRE